VNVTAQLTWVSATFLGAMLGQRIPDVSVLGLDFALTAMYAALLVSQIAHRPRCGSRSASQSWRRWWRSQAACSSLPLAIVVAAVVASTLGWS